MLLCSFRRCKIRYLYRYVALLRPKPKAKRRHGGHPKRSEGGPALLGGQGALRRARAAPQHEDPKHAQDNRPQEPQEHNPLPQARDVDIERVRIR